MIEQKAGDLAASRAAVERARAIAEGPARHRLWEKVSRLEIEVLREMGDEAAARERELRLQAD